LGRLPEIEGSAAGPGSALRPLLCAFLLVLCSIPHPARGSVPAASTDDRGRTLRLAAVPRRIVSLAPSLTEIVFLLGQEEKLVGVTRFCDHPPAAAGLPRVGGIVDPDVERIVAARPDLVLCTTDGNPRERVRMLEEAGIPCFAVGPQDLAAVYRTIERIADLLGVHERGRREADALRKRARRASRPGRGPSPRVLFLVSTAPVIAAGAGTFLDEIVRTAGGRNAAAGYAGRYPRLGVEDLIASGPDVVLVASMTGSETLPVSVTRWKEIPAFRNGDVVSLDGDLVTRPGPRLVDGLETVADVLSAWRAKHLRDGGSGAEEAR
jgi:iron complex transport system substrate-binding protein